MSFKVIDNPDFEKFSKQSGFRHYEFKQLAGLFSRASSAKALYDMAVSVDFDEGVCSVSYYRAKNAPPYLSFVIHHVGPRTDMYEVWLAEKGRIFKSGLFQRAYSRLEQEISALLPSEN